MVLENGPLNGPFVVAFDISFERRHIGTGDVNRDILMPVCRLRMTTRWKLLFACIESSFEKDQIDLRN